MSSTSTSSQVTFCPKCEKPFTAAASYTRHVRYCGNRTRNRPRSCLACNAAKAKCSFDVPCLRCAKKGIGCVYDTPQHRGASKRALSDETPLQIAPLNLQETDSTSSLGASAEHATEDIPPFWMMSGSGQDLSEMLSLDMDRMLSDTGSPSFDDLSVFKSGLSPQFRADQLSSFEANATLASHTAHWCDWLRGPVSLLPLHDETSTVSTNLYLQTTPPATTRTTQNAALIIQSLRSLPTKMLRKETLPWFIHPNAFGDELHSAISNCMTIAQVFAARTPESAQFLRAVIQSEHRRFTLEMFDMSKFELLASMQACMIYVIMYIIDYSPGDEDATKELLAAMGDLFKLLKSMKISEDRGRGQVSSPSSAWKLWIFGESQLRFANLWLLVGCAVCIRNGTVFDSTQSFRGLSLPYGRTLWEAHSHEAWETELEASHERQHPELKTLGDLIDAQRLDFLSMNAHKLDIWNAGADDLGFLLNLISTMDI